MRMKTPEERHRIRQARAKAKRAKKYARIQEVLATGASQKEAAAILGEGYSEVYISRLCREFKTEDTDDR